MNSKTVYLILRHLLLSAVILAGSGCSFKNDPNKNKNVQVVELEKKEIVKPLTAEEIIRLPDESEALAALSNFKIININDVKTADGSLLDTAIKNQKTKIIKELILRGHSTFHLSEASYHIIERSDVLSNMFLGLHRDAYHSILSGFPGKPDERLFDSHEKVILLPDYHQILKTQLLGEKGCIGFVHFLFQLRYTINKNENGDRGAYYEALSSVDIEDATMDTLTNSVCAPYISQFPTQQLSKWIADEIVFQFGQNFRSQKILTLLSSMTKSNSVSIELINFITSDWPIKITVDPLLLLVMKRDCLYDRAQFNTWYELIKRHVNLNPQFYTVSYFALVKKEPSNKETCANANECLDFLDMRYMGILMALLDGRLSYNSNSEDGNLCSGKPTESGGSEEQEEFW